MMDLEGFKPSSIITRERERERERETPVQCLEAKRIVL